MKRFLLVPLAALLLASHAFADTETVDGIEWTYTVSDGEASIGSGDNYGARAVPTSTSGAITIPSTLGGYPVTSIGRYAFYGCSGLASVTIPDSVTSILPSAFESCGALWAKWLVALSALAANGEGSAAAAPDPRYALGGTIADRTIAAITVDSDIEIGQFVLKDGKVYDTVLYVDNPTAHDVKLKRPDGNTYKSFKGAAPLTIPAKSQNLLTITRIAGRGHSPDVFLVSREELESAQ